MKDELTQWMECYCMGKISIAEVLRLRAASAVSRDNSVRRFALVDDFVGVLTKNIQNKLALMGHGPGCPQSQKPKKPSTHVLANSQPSFGTVYLAAGLASGLSFSA